MLRKITILMICSITIIQSELVSVLLEDVDCCNGAYDLHQTVIVPNASQIVTAEVPCCYASGFVSYGMNFINGTMTTRYLCDDSISAIFSPSVTYDPDMNTFCGFNAFMTDMGLPSDLSVTFSDASLIFSTSSNGSSISCHCGIQYSEFTLNETFRCTNNVTNNLCAVPPAITGYIAVNTTTHDNDTANDNCGCEYMFHYLSWQNISSGGTQLVEYEWLLYIPWTTDYVSDYSYEYIENCIQTKVFLCNSNAECVWSASNNVVDFATTHFNASGYLPSLSMECYCYSMMDLCALTTTVEMTTTAVSTTDATEAQSTNGTPSTDMQSTDGTPVDVGSDSSNYKLSQSFCTIIVAFIFVFV